MVEKTWGRIIPLTGPSAYLGVKDRPHATAKGAIGGLTKGLAIELGPFGITVNDVAPGEIDGIDPEVAVLARAVTTGIDPRHRIGAKIPVGRIGQPEEIAYACGFLASPRASFYTGTVMVCAGGEWATN
jgi:NAD(P)-dependent dehydrogenase (short-subunit alcohol dehydrogenase family)